MIKTLKLFSFAFLFVFASLFGQAHQNLDPYVLTVVDVDLESHRFVLSNKMVFQIAKNSWTADQLPEIGMEVCFAPLIRDVETFSIEEAGELDVYFLDKKKVIKAWMPEESKAYCLSYAGTESKCVQPAGWFSSAVYKDAIVLSDGSTWMTEKEGQLPFIEGDRVMLTKINDVQWGLMNFDQILLLRDSNGKRYERIIAIVVKPYQEGQGSN